MEQPDRVVPSSREGADSGMAIGEPSELRLRVSEAFVDDVGRNWARLDAEDLKALGATPGDVLLITGERATVARAAQAPATHCGPRITPLAASTRGHGLAGIAAQVSVRKVPYKAADSLLLAPVQAGLPIP